MKLTDFNDVLGEFILTILPEPLRMVDITSHKRHVFDEVFGVGWKLFGQGKQLISEDDIIFADTAPGVPGVKALGIRESFFKAALDVMLELETDQAFIKEMRDPDYRNTLKNIQDRLIKIFADGRAKCKILEIEEFDAEMEALAEDLISANTIYDFIVPTTKLDKFLKRTKEYIATLNLAKTTDKYKTAIQFKDEIEKNVGNSLGIIGWAGAFSAVRSKFGRIPVILGPVPLKHVDYVEVARSGKVLKFRATGSIFLASQEGGADAIKIEGKMYKAEFLLMFLLWGLFLYGQSKFREMENIPGLTELSSTDPTNIFKIRKLNDLLMTNTNLEKPSYEFHQTFPFVNRHFIIPNCYIETISIEDKLPLKDVLQYSILLRTYDKPKEVNWVGDNKGRALFGISNKTTIAKVCEYSLNAAWRILNASGWLLNEQQWKIGSAMDEGVLDTYYDVDWSTIATVSYLNLMGVAT